MRKKTIKQYLKGNFIIPQDNTRIDKLIPFRINLTPEQQRKILLNELYKLTLKNKSYIYDTKRANYYKKLQDFYNNNFFGYGIFGKQTKYDPSTSEGQAAILSNFDYAKSNITDFASNVAGTGMTGAVGTAGRKSAQLYNRLTKGVFKAPSKNGALGTMRLYTKKGTLGGGAEAVVVNNTPTTVGKMTSIPVEEMAARNLIPNTVSSKYIGYVKDRRTKLPTYIQLKVKVLTELTFPKYVGKLDKAMERSGFRRVQDPNVLYRAYTNGQVVVDDVAPGNVGLDWLRRPKMIDFNMLTVPEWTAQGFTLKDGGILLICR